MTVEVSACSCLQCVWGGSVFMHCFLLIWYQQLCLAEVGPAWTACDALEVEKEITGV